MSDEKQKQGPKKIDKKDAERLLRDVVKYFTQRFPMYKYGLYSAIDADVEFYAMMWEEIGIKDKFPMRVTRV